MPTLTFRSLDEVPADLREFVSQKDDTYQVSVVPSSRLEEFRNNNVALLKERDDLRSTLSRLASEADFSPDSIEEWLSQLKELRETKKLVEDGKLVKDSSLEEALASRTAEMQRAHEAQTQALRKAAEQKDSLISELRRRVDSSIIASAVAEAASDPKLGVRKDALRALIREIQDVFRIEEGDAMVPRDAKGEIIYGADATAPMSVREYIATRLSKDAPYLFESSQGGGAQGGKAGHGLSTADLDRLDPIAKMDLARKANRR